VFGTPTLIVENPSALAKFVPVETFPLKIVTLGDSPVVADLERKPEKEMKILLLVEVGVIVAVKEVSWKLLLVVVVSVVVELCTTCKMLPAGNADLTNTPLTATGSAPKSSRLLTFSVDTYASKPKAT